MKTVALQNTAVMMQRVSRASRSVSKQSSRSFLAGATRIPFQVASQKRSPASIQNRTMALFGGAKAAPQNLYDIDVTTIDGKTVSMNSFKGKVLLVVNLASQCGFTPQYAELVDLYKKYKNQGLEIIGQPCNQFGAQEGGSNSQIKNFAERNFGANFPMLAKGDINGDNELPLWTYLKSKKGGLLNDDIKWNFSKFIVDKNGNVVSRHPSTTTPLALEAEIKKLL